jgi:hypothetical protein
MRAEKKDKNVEESRIQSRGNSTKQRAESREQRAERQTCEAIARL